MLFAHGRGKSIQDRGRDRCCLAHRLDGTKVLPTSQRSAFSAFGRRSARPVSVQALRSEVNPAWTSVIGSVNDAARFGPFGTPRSGGCHRETRFVLRRDSRGVGWCNTDLAAAMSPCLYRSGIAGSRRRPLGWKSRLQGRRRGQRISRGERRPCSRHVRSSARLRQNRGGRQRTVRNLRGIWVEIPSANPTQSGSACVMG
jgi:hypothetical protein